MCLLRTNQNYYQQGHSSINLLEDMTPLLAREKFSKGILILSTDFGEFYIKLQTCIIICTQSCLCVCACVCKYHQKSQIY